MSLFVCAVQQPFWRLRRLVSFTLSIGYYLAVSVEARCAANHFEAQGVTMTCGALWAADPISLIAGCDSLTVVLW